MTRIAAILVAAGRGTRAGGDRPKQWQPLAGRRVIDWSLAGLRASPRIGPIVAVHHPEDQALAETLVDPELLLVPGGATRDASVRAGLAALAGHAPDLVLIHDAARPGVSLDVITGVIDALRDHDGAAPALPVIDALWTGAEGLVSGTQDRTGLYRAQTPQGFRYAALVAAHAAHPGGAADDVEVARAAGLTVAITAGAPENLKITTAQDFSRARRPWPKGQQLCQNSMCARAAAMTCTVSAQAAMSRYAASTSPMTAR